MKIAAWPTGSPQVHEDLAVGALFRLVPKLVTASQFDVQSWTLTKVVRAGEAKCKW